MITPSPALQSFTRRLPFSSFHPSLFPIIAVFFDPVIITAITTTTDHHKHRNPAFLILSFQSGVISFDTSVFEVIFSKKYLTCLFLCFVNAVPFMFGSSWFLPPAPTHPPINWCNLGTSHKHGASKIDYLLQCSCRPVDGSVYWVFARLSTSFSFFFCLYFRFADEAVAWRDDSRLPSASL